MSTLFSVNLNHTLISPLYSTTPTATLNGLNPLEKLWVLWYSSFSDSVLATGIFSFVLHELVYFGRSLPWMIIDRINYFKKWKLQPNKTVTVAQQWSCIKKVLLIHFSIELPQIYLFHPMAVSVGMKTYEVPFPTIWTVLFQVFIFSLLEDLWHYCIHILAHHPLLYRHVHKVHHEFSAPFGLAAEYAHPAETLVLGAGTVLAPLGYCWLTGNMHIITMYAWIVFRLLQAIDSHSGYDFPWSLNKFVPLWAGAEHHDHHHEKFTDCYSSSYTHLDWLFGTDKKYRAHRKAQREEAKKLEAKRDL